MIPPAQRTIGLLVACHALLFAGCATTKLTWGKLFGHGAVAKEAIETRADLNEIRRQERIAAYNDLLLRQKSCGPPSTETSIAMELDQSLDIYDITVDVEELKKAIARAEAYSRSEQLRQRRLPDLLREQEEALMQGGDGTAGLLNSMTAPGNAYGVHDNRRRAGFVEAVDYERTSVPARPVSDADDVVAVDEYGCPVPMCAGTKPTLAPEDIPYVVRMRVHLGLKNPRCEWSRVRHRGACGKGGCGDGPCHPRVSRLPSTQEGQAGDVDPSWDFSAAVGPESSTPRDSAIRTADASTGPRQPYELYPRGTPPPVSSPPATNERSNATARPVRGNGAALPADSQDRLWVDYRHREGDIRSLITSENTSDDR